MKTKPNVGDRVRWTSQSNGVTTTKAGVVVYSGPSIVHRRRIYANPLPDEVIHARNSHVMFDSVSSGVVVRVCAGQYTDGSSIYLYYAPRLCNLEVISHVLDQDF